MNWLVVSNQKDDNNRWTVRIKVNGNDMTFLISSVDYGKIRKLRLQWTTENYVRVCFPDRKFENLHNVLLDRVGIKEKDGKRVDHINRDRTDYRRCNLRVIPIREDSVNISKPINNTSGYVGVSFKDNKSGGYWEASIKIYGKRYVIKKKFVSREEAALARDLLKISLLDFEILSLNFEGVISKEKYYEMYMDDELLTYLGLNPAKRVVDHKFFRDVKK
jgi:hypothetical protein